MSPKEMRLEAIRLGNAIKADPKNESLWSEFRIVLRALLIVLPYLGMHDAWNGETVTYISGFLDFQRHRITVTTSLIAAIKNHFNVQDVRMEDKELRINFGTSRKYEVFVELTDEILNASLPFSFMLEY